MWTAATMQPHVLLPRQVWKRNIKKSIAIKASPYESAPPEGLLAVKSELITKPVSESIKKFDGKREPDKYDSIIIKAILIITEMCRSMSKYGRESWAEAWGNTLEKLMQYAIERAGLRIYDPVKDRQNDRDAR